MAINSKKFKIKFRAKNASKFCEELFIVLCKHDHDTHPVYIRVLFNKGRRYVMDHCRVQKGHAFPAMILNIVKLDMVIALEQFVRHLKSI